MPLYHLCYCVLWLLLLLLSSTAVAAMPPRGRRLGVRIDKAELQDVRKDRTINLKLAELADGIVRIARVHMRVDLR